MPFSELFIDLEFFWCMVLLFFLLTLLAKTALLACTVLLAAP